MTPFTDKDLKKDITSGSLKNLYFLYGEEKYLISVYEKRLIDKILGGKMSGFDYMLFDSPEPDFYNISLALESFPVTGGKKCVVIRDLNLDTLKAEESQKLYDIISDIPEFSVFIISQSTLQMDSKLSAKWNKFMKFLSKYGSPVIFQKTSKAAAAKQLVRWAKLLNKTLSEKNALIIIERCGRDFNVLRNELEKVCALESGEEINEETIKSITTATLETNVFNMCKEIMSGNYPNAYKYMEILFYNREEPIAILAAIASNFIDMYRVRAAVESGMKTGDVSKYFDYKNKEFKLNIAEKNSRYMSMVNIRKAIKILTKADLRLKDTGAEPRIIMDELIIKIIELRENQ